MALADYLNQTITITPLTSYNEYGDSTYGVPVTVKARFEDEREIVEMDNGEQVGSSGRFWVLPTVAVAKDHKVSYNGVDYRVIKVYHGYRRTGDWHKKVYVQKWKL